MKLGERISQLRKEKHQTQAQLAELIGVSSQVISNYERNYREPEVLNLIKLADVFETTIDFLVGRSNERSHNK